MTGLCIKYTGTTEGFEHYYGEIIYKGKVLCEYYGVPRRGKPMMYFLRGEIKGKQIKALSLDILIKLTAPKDDANTKSK